MRRTKLFVGLASAILLALASVTAFAEGPDGSGWWTNITIQNTSSSSTANVTVTAYTQDSADTTTYGTSSYGLAANTSVIYHPGLDATCGAAVSSATSGCRIGFSTALPSGFEGAAVVSSDSPVVSIVALHNNASGSVGVSSGSARGSYQGMDSSSAATTLYFPTVKNNFVGQTTAFFVQAAGVDANVTMTYTMQNGSTFVANQTISANKSHAFFPAAASVPSCNGGNNTTCIGGAILTSDQPVAGSIVEYVDGASVADFVLATRALTPADAGQNVIAPTLKSDFYGSSTGASILNTGTDAQVVNLSFSVTNTDNDATCNNTVGQTVTDSVTVPAGGSVVVSRFQNNIGGLDDCTFFAMTATSDDNPIVVTVNENNSGKKAVYFGFNSANATTNVALPLVKENFPGSNAQTTGITVVNAGSAPTTVTATYVSSGGTTHVIQSQSIAAGEAVPFFQIFNSPSHLTATSGGFPSAGTKHSVTISSSGEPIVALAQESDRANDGSPLDIYNYEGFNQ